MTPKQMRNRAAPEAIFLGQCVHRWLRGGWKKWHEAKIAQAYELDDAMKPKRPKPKRSK